MFNEGRKGKKIKCEEENDMLKSHLGFQKTTNKVSIGRRLTKSLLKRKIFIQVILSCLLGVAMYYGVNTSLSVLVGTMILFIVIQVIAYGLGLGEMNTLSIQPHSQLFVEFDDSGIHYVDNKTFKERIKYARDVLKGKEQLHHVHYDQIDYVQVQKVTRFMKIPGSNLATEMNTYDYYFQLKDGKTYNLINAMILQDDGQKIDNLLNQYIQNKQEDK